MVIMVLTIKTNINIITTTFAAPNEPYGEDQIELNEIYFALEAPKLWNKNFMAYARYSK